MYVWMYVDVHIVYVYVYVDVDVDVHAKAQHDYPSSHLISFLFFSPSLPPTSYLPTSIIFPYERNILPALSGD
jgi:hypothetical protein